MRLASLFCFSMIFNINAKVILESNTTATTVISTKKIPTKSWLYKDYIKKFEITKIWKDLQEKSRKAGKKAEMKNNFDHIFSKIDETDELLSLKIEKGDPKILINKETRRKDDPGGQWYRRAPKGFIKYGIFRPNEDMNYYQPSGWGAYKVYDPFFQRYRLNELMKQAIYDTRNRLIGWQLKRERLKNDSLYKMGFLTSKIDETVKNYLRMSTRSYKACVIHKNKKSDFGSLSDILDSLERLQFKWFAIDLYTDLLTENDDNAREIIANTTVGRKVKWKFKD